MIDQFFVQQIDILIFLNRFSQYIQPNSLSLSRCACIAQKNTASSTRMCRLQFVCSVPKRIKRGQMRVAVVASRISRHRLWAAAAVARVHIFEFMKLLECGRPGTTCVHVTIYSNFSDDRKFRERSSSRRVARSVARCVRACLRRVHASVLYTHSGNNINWTVGQRFAVESCERRAPHTNACPRTSLRIARARSRVYQMLNLIQMLVVWAPPPPPPPNRRAITYRTACTHGKP